MPYKDRHGNTCGFLDFEEREGSGHFVRRYFLLDPGRKAFDYYMDNPQNLPPDSRAMGSFKAELISMVGDAAKSKPKLPFCFYLTLAGRKYFFCANDKADKDEWITTLLDTARVSVPTPKSVLEGSMDSLDSVSSYKAEVAGDVVIKIPLEHSNSQTAEIEGDSEDEIDTSPGQAYCRQHALKTGYCIKQGGRRKNWLRRFFVLNLDGLSYFKSPEDRSPIKTIPKAEIYYARESIGIHLTKENVFEVVTPGRVYYLQADTEAERTSWICEIKRVLNTSKKTRQEIEEQNSQFVLAAQSQSKKEFHEGSKKGQVEGEGEGGKGEGGEEDQKAAEVKVGVRLLPKYTDQTSL